ncbi:MAG: tRNA pseudouridine(38-40) synthase TruA [Oscillospiraceae bacterium]|nr:tRNA pseudouridine(38-40) synthase TruA [Oscillospiraceae bacterium]
MQNYQLVLCYEGSRYRGWQKQGNTDNTIQARMEVILSRLLGQPVELAASGRTDAGVHARRQVCSFRAETALSCGELLASLRALLPADIGALSLTPAPPRFHARLSCTGKTYVYRIWNSDAPNVFRRRCMLQLPNELDLDAMRAAASLLTGRHDFSAFCSAKRMKKSPVRELSQVQIAREGEELRLIFTGDGFLYNMVRILTGTLLEVGGGTRDAQSMPRLLESRDRALAGPTAPAHGLTLWDVYYDGEEKRREALSSLDSAGEYC